MEYIIDDSKLSAESFLSLAQKVWPGDYNIEKTQKALGSTINITAYEGKRFVGCIRILTDDLKTHAMECIRDYYRQKGVRVHFSEDELYFTCDK